MTEEGLIRARKSRKKEEKMDNSEIKISGYKALVKELGEVEAGRFISLIQSEPFNYTKWQKDLWTGKSIEEISSATMKHRKAKTERQNKVKKGA